MPEADAALLEAEAELQALVIEIETLNALWPAAEPATRRAKIGTCLYSAYERLGELYSVISNAEPRTSRRRRRAVASGGGGASRGRHDGAPAGCLSPCRRRELRRRR